MDTMLSKLINAFGTSGNEKAVRNVIKDELKDVDVTINEDKMGNVIVKAGDSGSKVMMCAHMDQIGFIVSYIEENGLIRVEAIGDFKPENINHSFIKFNNGTAGKIVVNHGELFIDTGITDKNKVLEKVKEGDTACFVGPYLEVGDNNIISPNLDNRVGCYALLKLIKEIKDLDKEVYFIFSTQKELGGRGARAAAHAINPDYCIVIDLEEAGDVIGGKNNIKLNNGPIIKVMDKTLIMHNEIKEIIEEAAKKSQIKIQYGVFSSKSDGGTIHKERLGIKTGEISIPCRYKNSSLEMINMNDVEQTIKLLKNLL